MKLKQLFLAALASLLVLSSQAFAQITTTPGEPDTDILLNSICLLYTSDAADDLLCVDLGGRRLIQPEISASLRLCVRLLLPLFMTT